MRNLSCRASVRRAPSRKSAAFTLIELLTVIAIIGILAAIIIPTVGTVREKAQRAVDSNNLREILKAAQIYAGDNQDKLPDPRAIATTIPIQLNAPQRAALWPGILAKNNILTDPTFYFAKNDPAFSGIYPQFIINPSAQRNTLHASFLNRSFSWEFVGGLKMSDPANSPVVYTRGLQSNGTWNANSGVYKDVGGYIAFLGGNIAFYSNTNLLFTPNSSTSAVKQTDIRAAVPFSATATSNSLLYAIPPPGGPTLGSVNGTPAIQAR